MGSVQEGVILKGIGSFYYIMDEAGNMCQLRARGKLRHLHLQPMIGDRVRFIPGEGDRDGSIEEILPRDNMLIRPPVANIHRLLIVIAPGPEPDLMMVDMLLTMAAKQNIATALIVNKCDTDSTLYPEIARQYRGLQAPILALSAKDGTGLDELRALLREGVVCFAGQSGVGKSSLTEAATGIHVETGEISRKISRGKHTTRHAELLVQGEYRVLDTPGFSLLELWEGLEPIGLQDYYPEFEAYNGKCRFSPCYHNCEPGCAVQQAADMGQIDKQRLERYRLLLEKASLAWKNRYH